MPPSDANSERKSIAVVGLGSIGGVVAGLLRATNRYDIVACVRRPIEKLTVERAEGTIEIPITGLTDPALAKPVDWVLLCTKAQDTATSAAWLQRLCGTSTRVASLQNGIGHADRLRPLVGQATVVPTIVYYNGERLDADRVRLRRGANQDFVVADDDAGRAFAQLFEGTPLRVDCGDDFVTLAWRKLLINAVASPVTALTLQRQAVLRRPDIQTLCLAVLEEAIAVGRAEGAKLAADEAARTLATLFTFSGELGTSMYFDRLAGRPLEHEALTGAIVAAGERHGIATPLNRALLPLLRAISDAAGK